MDNPNRDLSANESDSEESSAAIRLPPAGFVEAVTLLTCGEVRDEHGMLRWSSNYTFLVTVADQDSQTMAVYKPQRGERALWDFPDGTLCYREVGSFLVSEALGWRIVPPTVLRSGPRGIGSVQWFIPGDPNVNYFTFALDPNLAPQLRRMSAFDYLVNNADRKGGHCLLDSEQHVWGIDHGITFHTAPKLRTVIWDFAGETVPDDIIEDVEGLYVSLQDETSPLKTALDKLLAAGEVQALMARTRRLITRREYPRPGPGPNYPWPPV